MKSLSRPTLKPDLLPAKNTITYIDSGLQTIQIDLQDPLEIDSIVQDGNKLNLQREGNVFHVQTPDKDRAK